MMHTQPLRRVRAAAPRVGEHVLLGLAALFVIGGAVMLHFTAPTRALTTWHLVSLVLGWMVAWGSSAALLRARLPHADPLILPLVALLTGWGLLILARLAPGFLHRQIIWLFIGCAAMCATALLPTATRMLRRYRYTFLAAGLLLLGATLVFGVNPSGYGARRWLGAFGIYFQPSELLKLLLVAYLAAYLAENRALMREPTIGRSRWPLLLGPMLTMLSVAMILLAWQQDLGAALLFYLTFVAMLHLAWGRRDYTALSLLLFMPVALAGYLFSARVALRVSIWLDPWSPAQADRAFQILQSLFALADGGLVGQGLGLGLPTLIPAVHTDFVYVALVEEFGIIGGVALIALLALLVTRGIVLAQRAQSPFESLLAGGIAALIGIQTWVIVGGSIKLIPLTGVTLPYLSYGGSSMLTTMIATGLLINLSAPHPPPLDLALPTSPTPPIRKTAGELGRAMLLLLLSVALGSGYWAVLQPEALRTYPTNARRILADSRIRRGRILDRNGVLLAGITLDDRGYVTRTYPHPEAAPVVGYATLQYGTDGIEAVCDARLRGDAHRAPVEALWDDILHRDPAGRDVRLTLDMTLQAEAQRLLRDQRGAVVLVDARTGDVLALASAPTYAPATVEAEWATLRDDPAAPLLNRATQGLAQPGAILQTVVLAATLAPEAETFPPITAPLTQPVAINGDVITCAAIPRAETWQAALSAACPAPFARLAETYGAERIADTFAAWSLTTAPAFDLPTVAALWPPATIDLPREALGQGDLLVTPLQMVGVAATLGNAGNLPPLHLLAEEYTGCKSRAVGASRPILSPEEAARLRAQWPRYGTAIGHVGSALAGPERTQVWFIGLNSPQAPRYAVAVLLESPARPDSAATIGTRLLHAAVGP